MFRQLFKQSRRLLNKHEDEYLTRMAISHARSTTTQDLEEEINYTLKKRTSSCGYPNCTTCSMIYFTDVYNWSKFGHPDGHPDDNGEQPKK